MLDRPPIRIGNVSGATGDHPHAMARMVRSGNVNVITGDWLSEMNIAWNAITKQEVDPDLGYENGFFEQLDECLDDIMQRDIRVVTNAAYIGCWGIVQALRSGARIVICGRCTDASPVMGAAAWTSEGGGRVTKETVTAQLLYELQGHLYLNPDVVADLSGVRVEQEATNRVVVSGVKGRPPPSTTKVMIAAKGGFQAEATFYINGLDVAEKAAMMKAQLAYMFKDSNFSRLSIELYGTPADNPTSQQAGTVSLRVFAQARKKEDIEPSKFKVPIYALRMQSYPGYHMNLDFRTMTPKPFMEMFPALMPMSAIDHRVEMSTGEVLRLRRIRMDLLTCSLFGATEWAPLGSVVHARSGDKGDNSNVGFFVRNDDEYPWLRNLLTVSKIKQLFGDDWFKGNPDRRVERVEFPGVNAVHFRILDNLNGGIASSDRIDGLGKGIAEYLRSRYVDVPKTFLERGRI
ncbi:hypothetical protein CEP52_012925 [Fusarium oligoseptatum]|uniref:Uncharacterized protein n=1 Tax=Fusarium oligoseptatum TaxID=2604345 RepID=A0A428SW04_9HYPO|nr:hypothetical protein CEP52_012925 [Fusarium oligoseptatum]